MAISFGSLDIDVVSSTLQHMLPEIIDGLYQSTPFLNRCEKGGFTEKNVSGSTYVAQIEVKDQSVLQTQATGWSPINMTVQSTSNQMQYNWASANLPVLWDGKALRENTGEEALVKLAVQRAKTAHGHALRALEERFVRGSAGPGVDAGITAFNTLNGNVTAGVPSGFGSTAGFLQNLAPTTAFVQTNTIGGLARTSVAQINNQFRDQDAFTNLKSAMFAIDSDCTIYRQGSQTFDLVIASPTAFATYRGELESQERYMTTDKELNALGIVGLMFGNAPVIASNYTDLTSTEKNSMMLLDLSQIHPAWVPGGDFKMGELNALPGYDGVFAYITVHGQLVAHTLASSGLIVDAE